MLVPKLVTQGNPLPICASQKLPVFLKTPQCFPLAFFILGLSLFLLLKAILPTTVTLILNSTVSASGV